jgi:hypothetical protein
LVQLLKERESGWSLDHEPGDNHSITAEKKLKDTNDLMKVKGLE